KGGRRIPERKRDRLRRPLVRSPEARSSGAEAKQEFLASSLRREPVQVRGEPAGRLDKRARSRGTAGSALPPSGTRELRTTALRHRRTAFSSGRPGEPDASSNRALPPRRHAPSKNSKQQKKIITMADAAVAASPAAASASGALVQTKGKGAFGFFKLAGGGSGSLLPPASPQPRPHPRPAAANAPSSPESRRRRPRRSRKRQERRSPRPPQPPRRPRSKRLPLLRRPLPLRPRPRKRPPNRRVRRKRRKRPRPPPKRSEQQRRRRRAEKKGARSSFLLAPSRRRRRSGDIQMALFRATILFRKRNFLESHA
ncbi:hypothetical protein ILUMI_16473, partial [Ignelater luminosus]